MPSTGPRYLLLQGRLLEDPMRIQEIRCFTHALGCDEARITPLDLLRDRPSIDQLEAFDVVFIGGSGAYSIAGEEDWVEYVLETMRGLFDRQIPTFGSCWGFQVMARALGGTVVTDPERAELGTIPLTLTDAALQDPVFGGCTTPLLAQQGHQDIVTTLPPGAVLLASSRQVVNEAFCFTDRPIYCTQFHPELRRGDFLERCHAYPQYVNEIAGLPLDEFIKTVQETPQAHQLIRRFVDHVLP
jgi:GMP synthase (glutamine-hydrolysing)